MQNTSNLFLRGVDGTFLICTTDWSGSKFHYSIIKWKQSTRYWPFAQGIHRAPVNFPHKGQWRGVWCFFLICAWTNGCVNNRDAGDLRRHRTHYDATVIFLTLNLGFRCLAIRNHNASLIVPVVSRELCYDTPHMQWESIIEKWGEISGEPEFLGRWWVCLFIRLKLLNLSLKIVI